MKRTHFAVTCLLFLLPALSLAQEAQPPASGQQQAQPPAKQPGDRQPPKAKAKKVWTEDDVKALRKGFDEYGGQKAPAEPPKSTAKPAEKAAAAPEPDQAKTDTIPGGLPNTVEEAEARISDKRHEIALQVELIARVRDAYFNETDEDQRARLAKKRDELNTDFNTAQAELKILQARLEQLKAKSGPQQSEKGAEPSTTPPPPARPPQS